MPDTSGSLGIQQAGATNPLGIDNAQLGTLLQQLIMPMLQQHMKQNDLVPGPMHPGINFADYQRQMEDQRQMMAAMGQASNSDRSRVYNSIRGAHHLTKFGWGPEQQKYGDMLSDAFQAGSPFLGMLGEDAERLLAPAAFGAKQMVAAGKMRLDPVAGSVGVDGSRMGQMTTDLSTMLYGPNGDASSVRGFTMDRIGEMIRAGTDRGMGPSSIRASLSNNDVEQLRNGGNLSAEALKNISTAEATKLTAGPGSLDDKLQEVDTERMKAWSTKMSGAMSAMRELFGPNAPMEQMFESMDAMTQGGFSRYSPEQMEATVRQMRQLSKASGTSIDTMMSLQVLASDAAERAGGNRSFGVDAAMHSTAWGAAFKSGGIGASDLSLAGVSLNELQQQDAMLTAQASASPLAKQLAATAAIGDQMGFKKGSEAEAFFKAIQAGETEYTFGSGNNAVTKSLHVTPQDWAKMMAEGGGMSMAQAQAIRMANNDAANDKYNIGSIGREMQWDVDISRGIKSSLTSALATGGVQDMDKLTDVLSQELRDFKPKAGQPEEEARKDLIDRMADIVTKNSNMDQQQAQAAVMGAIGSADEIARKSGGYKGGLYNQILAHRRDVLQGGAAATQLADYDQQVASTVSGLGQKGIGNRVMDMLQTATPDTELVPTLLKLLGGVERDDVQAAWAGKKLDTKLGDLMKEYDTIRGRTDSKTGKFRDDDDEKRFAEIKAELGSTTSKMAEMRAVTIEKAKEATAKLGDPKKDDPKKDDPKKDDAQAVRASKNIDTQLSDNLNKEYAEIRDGKTGEMAEAKAATTEEAQKAAAARVNPAATPVAKVDPIAGADPTAPPGDGIVRIMGGGLDVNLVTGKADNVDITAQQGAATT